jgi:hypothetical protein
VNTIKQRQIRTVALPEEKRYKQIFFDKAAKRPLPAQLEGHMVQLKPGALDEQSERYIH